MTSQDSVFAGGLSIKKAESYYYGGIQKDPEEQMDENTV